MNARPLILGTLLAAGVGVAGVAIWQFTHGVDGGAPVPGSAPVVKVKPRTAPSSRMADPGHLDGKPETMALNGEIHPGGGHEPASNFLPSASISPAPNSQPLTEQQLRRRAAAVEQEANHDLKHLIGLLDLTETQQDRIFDSLVRHAPGWHPAMQTSGGAMPVGAAAGTPDPFANPTAPAAVGTGTEPAIASRNDLLDAIASELTPDQQVELANAELERQEWWEEIIGKLMPTQDTPTITGETGPGVAASPPPAGDKSGEQPDVLAE
jgi:hypothetical protein